MLYKNAQVIKPCLRACLIYFISDEILNADKDPKEADEFLSSDKFREYALGVNHLELLVLIINRIYTRKWVL